MSSYGFRDGVINVRALKTHQKRYHEDKFFRPYASTLALDAAVDLSSATITDAGITVGTQIDYPRAVKFVNALQAASERALKIAVKGYDGQGAYQEEVFTLSTAATGRTAGSKAFAYISSYETVDSTGGRGTYGTVGLYPTDKFGLSEYCEGAGDGLGVSLATVGLKTFATTNRVAAKVSVSNQTVELAAKNKTRYELIGVRYLSKFQRRHTDTD